MKKQLTKICLLISFALSLFLIACGSTNNEIYNKSYDVNIEIDDISEYFVPAIEKASESIVGVSTYVRRNILSSWQLAATGSGVVYKASAKTDKGEIINDIAATKDRTDISSYTYNVITNHHVISSPIKERSIKVYLGEENIIVQAKILGYNITEDLAVIQFTTSVYISPIEFADSDSIKKGELVLALGNAEGYEYYSSATLGIVSYPKRYVSVDRDMNSDGTEETSVYCEYIQHDAGINAGNSGGALVNAQGKLIGINTMKLVDDENSIEGMGFAIPINLVDHYLEALENGETQIAYELKGDLYTISQISNRELFKDIPLITLDGFTYEYGLYVYKSANSSLYGIKNNDVILKVDDNKVTSLGAFSALLRMYEKGDTISFTVYRDNEEKVINTILR